MAYTSETAVLLSGTARTDMTALISSFGSSYNDAFETVSIGNFCKGGETTGALTISSLALFLDILVGVRCVGGGYDGF